MRTILAGLAAFGLLVPLSGCSVTPFQRGDSPVPCPKEAGGPLSLVIGARANSPKPVLPEEIKTLVREAAKQDRTVKVIRLDGTPSVAMSATFKTEGKNDQIRNRDLDTFMQKTLNFVAGLTPKHAEADVLAGLTEAAHATPEGGTIVLVDSGLATAGSLSFTKPEMFGADPAEAAKFLEEKKLLPTLTGRSVVLAGFGNTADPQPALNERQRNQVTGLWQTIAEKAGAACVFAMDTTAQRTSVDTTVAVTVVKLPEEPTFKPCGTTILADSGSVGFLPDQAVFRDKAAAAQTLQSLAAQMLGNTKLVTLTGTTAGTPIKGESAGAEQIRVDLSRRRADAVKAELIRLGVPADRITTVGAGSRHHTHIDDRLPNGGLEPVAAAKNRSVVVELRCKS